MTDWKHIYFIGIGGIGMSALARYFKFKGKDVSGYDRTPSELTAELEKEGIRVHYEDNPAELPGGIKDTLVIYTPAVPDNFGELTLAREKGYRVIKRSMALGEITSGQICLGVAGTHGKTTTSTLLAHILSESGEGCSAFLGGISKNYGTNMLMSKSPVVVVESDEFDRSFLQLHPAITAITAMDADHLDIYGDLKHLQDAFRQYASQVSETIILKYGLPVRPSDVTARIYTYHFNDTRADFHSENLRLDAMGHYTYDLKYPGGCLKDIKVGTLGWVNVENSIAAAAVALCHGVDAQKVRHAVASFTGVRRRLDEHFNNGSRVYVDDYAHHPEELSAAISSLRGIFPGKKITGIFQPHLYTRTRDFAPEFAKSLSALDKVILLDIYPAREEPLEGVSSEMIFKDITAAEKLLIRKEELMELLEKEDNEVLCSFGAGNIDRFVEPITEMFVRRYEN